MIQSSPYIRRLPATLSLLSLLTVGCDSPESVDEDAAFEAAVELPEVSLAPPQFGDPGQNVFEIDATPDDHEDELEVQNPSSLLARIERGTASVEWRDAGRAEVLLVIGGTANDAPILDMDTAESLTAVQAWVAVADQPTAVPERLLVRATESELALLADAGQIEALRADVRAKLDHVAQIQAQPVDTLVAGTCSSTQISTARSVFGEGYTSSSTCGDNLGFQNTQRNHLYCNSGSDCDYGLATMEGSCSPAVNSLAYLTGTLAATTMRSKTTGNPTFVTGTHRIRGFAYNCQGDGSINVHMEYDTNTWDQALASGYYVGAVWLGTSHLPGRPIAIQYVSYGSWDNGISASGSTYEGAEYSITGNAGANDFGIFCSDAQKSLTMNAGATGNAYSWCIGSCSVGNCWD